MKVKPYEPGPAQGFCFLLEGRFKRVCLRIESSFNRVMTDSWYFEEILWFGS